MQPVTPSTPTGTFLAPLLLGVSAALGAGELVEHLPRHRLGERLLDRDARRLAAARVDAGLGARLQLLGALRRYRDEPELGVHVLRKNQLAHAVFVSSPVSNVLQMARARSATAGTPLPAARMMDFGPW